MTNPIKIAICTKGRGGHTISPDGTKRYQAMNPGKIYEKALKEDMSILDNVYLFIEPQDVEAYRETYPKWPAKTFIVLGGDNKGLGYSRQTALLYFQEVEPTEVMVMLDDDTLVLEQVYKPHPKTGQMRWTGEHRDIYDGIQTMWEYIQTLPEPTDGSKVAQVGCEYVQMVWSKYPNWPTNNDWVVKRPIDAYTDHGYCDCCVFWWPLVYKEHGIVYDNLPLKCDRDFTAQVNYKGLAARKIYRFSIDSPLNGKVAGGCQQWYKTDGQEHSEVVDLVENKWNKAYPKAELVKFKEKKTSYGRTSDVKWWWTRLFHARVKNLIQQEVVNLYSFDESINKYRNLDNYLAGDAE